MSLRTLLSSGQGVRMIEVPTLSDGVVRLRRHSEDDVPGIVEQSNDPRSVAWTTVPQPYGVDDAKRFVREIMPGGWASDQEWGFAIEVAGRFGGTMSLRNKGDGRAEVGFGAHPSIRGRGHMERGLRLLLGWGFADRGLDVVAWWANAGNWGSRRLAASVGFSFDGTVRRWLPHRGALVDAWVGTLLRDDPLEFRTPWLDVPTLEADGVRLRPMRDGDVPGIVEACSDERTQHWLGGLPSPYTSRSALTYLESQRENRATDSGLSWAITSGSDELVGAISLFSHERGVEAELGYWMHPSARGRGLMTRAVQVVTSYAFDGLGLAKVKVAAAVGNAASLYVIESCGFRRYGVERDGTAVRGGRADLAWYDVLAKEWRSTR